MADTVLKFPPDEKAAGADAPAKMSFGQRLRSKMRLILLVIVPLIAVAVGLAFYLNGGRYISTDNAYVGSTKVLITPDVAGKVSKITVREGQHVNAGDELFEIDQRPFQIAVTQAESRLASTQTDLANLKSNLQALGRQIDLAKENVSLRQADVDRKSSLLATHSGSSADVDASKTNLMNANAQLEQLLQQQATTRNQLLGDPNLPAEKYPPYQLASAALDQAKLDLSHTTLRAPIAGIATQADNIQLGRYVAAGTPILSVVDDQHPWVDANPKETDITYLKPGQQVSLTIDSFPDRTFRGVVSSVSPGTGAQFSILPPQNASGNWVKVVQRVPVRITFAPGQDVTALRSGMSSVVSIDTKRQRSLAGLLGLSPATAEE